MDIFSQILYDKTEDGGKLLLLRFRDEANEFVRLADNSMYKSKIQGKNTYTFCCRNTKTSQKYQ